MENRPLVSNVMGSQSDLETLAAYRTRMTEEVVKADQALQASASMA
jgi:phosphoribosylcarboxyaminoimidazole (NCAIR) mutase